MTAAGQVVEVRVPAGSAPRPATLADVAAAVQRAVAHPETGAAVRRMAAAWAR